MKLYDVIRETDGSIKVVTELTPNDINAMLELALGLLLSRGMAPTSIAHHFFDESEPITNMEQPVTVDGEATKVEPEVAIPTVKQEKQELTEDQRKQLLESLPDSAFFKAG